MGDAKMEPCANEKYLYAKLYESLKAEIGAGKYPIDCFLPSEQQIGKIYGVDRATVRRALKLLVNDGIVEKKAGVGTKVKPYPAPPGNGPIAFFLPKSRMRENRITQPFYSTLFYNIEKSCRQQGYQVAYSTLDETDDVGEILKNGGFSGIIFVSNILRSHMDYALSQKFPCVLINGYYDKLPCVLQDNVEGTYLACRHLISLGHRKIAFLKGIADYISTIERMRGCLTAMHEQGVPISEKYMTEYDWDTASATRATEELLRRLGAGQYPTAIVGFNDASALGAIQAVARIGLRVPEDVSVTGFDNVEQAEFSLPSLTTVDTNIPLMAATAVQTLLWQLKNSRMDAIKLVVPVKLIVRNSTAPLAIR
ncbi:hypothetical protein FACS1894187_11610 [Synergistales bacterium]|nr:hypothetical protein FACS1894187_11610 [Synergistales bacterium]